VNFLYMSRTTKYNRLVHKSARHRLTRLEPRFTKFSEIT